MSEQPFDRDGDSAADQKWEDRLQKYARAFPYAPTPDIAHAVRERLSPPALRRNRHRRLLWAAILLIVLLCGLLAVPQVRAAIGEWLRIGSVIILPNKPTLTPSPTGTVTPPPPTATLLPSLLNLAGETTFADAQAKVSFAINLPAYPPDLGPPNKVFLQQLDGPAIILVWTDPSRPDGVRLSFHILTSKVIAYKIAPKIIKETTVHGQRAIWTEGPYILDFKWGNSTAFNPTRIVSGNTLIWTNGGLTYRLEGGGLTLEEAVKIAESIPLAGAHPSGTRTSTETPSG